MKTTITLLAALALAGCVSQQEQLARQEAQRRAADATLDAEARIHGGF